MDLVIPKMKHFSLPLIAILLACSALPAHARSGANSKAEEEAGAVLFRDKGCAYCHGVGGIGGKKAPSLADLRTDKAWPPAKIATQIRNGGQKMPPFGDSLTNEQIAQLVDYLRAKTRPVPPPTPALPAAQPAPPAAQPEP